MDDSRLPVTPAFTRRDYPRIRAESTDWMPATFDKWWQQTYALELAQSRAMGRWPPHIRIKPERLEAWLSANGLHSTEVTRAQYALIVASERARLRGVQRLAAQQDARRTAEDPTMPAWANRLQFSLTAWWARYGLR